MNKKLTLLAALALSPLWLVLLLTWWLLRRDRRPRPNARA